ncbi:hypothetical protein N8I77_008567 [Diaporthe amygdali]|uniref:Uncharacterized protein n=1 Tax=Phomopsis amygdali TaxID=1214568 RepID=A0AAD9W4K2_PHOAM|nr:hypothetical protein N8I77_008567 [Diaporthe amygdali]
MEFAHHSSAPFIADVGSEQDWSRQHVAEQIHMADSSKGSGLLPLRRRSVFTLKRRASSDVRHRPENGPVGVSKRRRVDRPTIINKPLSPADKARSASDWEQMLKLSINNLQGLYAKMDTPASATGRLLGDMFPQRVADSDPSLAASRAMHHAAGCCTEGGLDEDEDAYSSTSSDDMESDSSSDDQPATPDTAQMDEGSDVDGELNMVHTHTS